jgi:hypothetical protein
MVTFGCTANFTAITPEEAEETMDEIDENPVDIVKQSVPDEDPDDEIVHGLDVLSEVKLPSTIRK